MILRTFHIICRRCILSSIFLFLMLFVLGGIYVTKCYATYYNLYLTSGSLGVSKGNKGLSFNVPNSGGLILSSITKGNASGNPFPELLTKKGTIYVDDHDGTGVQNATAGGSEGIAGDGSDKYESLIFTFPSPADAQQVSMAFNEDFKSPGVALWVEPLSGSAIHVPQSSVWSYRQMAGYESGYINFWEPPELSGVGLITRIAVRAPAGIHVFVKRIAYEICTPCAEVCNDGIDNDCDGATDCADTNCAAACQSVSYYCDNDSDGYKDASVDGTCTGTGCQPAGCQVTPGNDCNDTDNAIHPGAAELCDGKNNDCNGATADGSGESWYGTACDGPDTDLCKEGTYGCTGGAQVCSDSTGNTAEVCTGGLDEDCDTATDCADSDCNGNPACPSVNYYCDNDSDGYKDASVDGTCAGAGCQPAGCQTTVGNDCNDTDAAIHPGAVELCDGKNNDCNGATADGSGESWYGTACDGPDTDLCKEGTYGCTGCAKVCSDSTGNTAEVCTGGLDEDCDTAIDCADTNCTGNPACTTVSYYCDNDSDTYKDASLDGTCTGTGCQPAGCQTTVGNDCNDTDNAIHPGAAELCDNKNNDCNAGTPDGSGEAWYGTACDGADTDLCKEGTYGCTGGAQVCSDNTGNTAEVCTGGLDNDCDGATDCADTANCPPGVTPCCTANEVGSCFDGINNDCDGATDCADSDCAAACLQVTYYCDNDNDTYKDASVDGTCTGVGCQPAGCQTTVGNDCNDTDAAIHPGAVELCDGKNNDCNGATADGSGESWYGTACDGPDTDLCKEGTYGCTGGAQVCSDSTGNTVEVCTGGLDEDCDTATDCADSDCPTPVVKSTNAQGSNKDTYTTNDAVYITGSHLPANTNVNIYI